jgi:hypothetical protein
MGGGGKGGSEATEIKLPPEIEQAAKDNLKIANEVASIGYTPYVGPSIAGFTPQQMNAMQNVDQSANSFGMANQLGGTTRAANSDAGPVNPGPQGAAGPDRSFIERLLNGDLSGDGAREGFGFGPGAEMNAGGDRRAAPTTSPMPQQRPTMSQAEIGSALTGMQAPNAQAGGFSGYSAAPLYNEMLGQMPEAQRAAIEAFTMDPYTGRHPENPTVPQPEWMYSGEGNWWEDNPIEEEVKKKEYTWDPTESNRRSAIDSRSK